MTNSILRIKEQRKVLEQLTAHFLNLLKIYQSSQMADHLGELIKNWDFFTPYEVMWILKVARYGQDELRQYLEGHSEVHIRESIHLRDAICFSIFGCGGNNKLIGLWQKFDHYQVW